MISVIKNASQPSWRGSSDWFTGTVRVDGLFNAPASAPTGTNTAGDGRAWFCATVGS